MLVGIPGSNTSVDRQLAVRVGFAVSASNIRSW